MILCPVLTAQSTMSFKSKNSPTPRPSLERIENIGSATPAPRHEVADCFRILVRILALLLIKELP